MKSPDSLCLAHSPPIKISPGNCVISPTSIDMTPMFLGQSVLSPLPSGKPLEFCHSPPFSHMHRLTRHPLFRRHPVLRPASSRQLPPVQHPGHHHRHRRSGPRRQDEDERHTVHVRGCRSTRGRLRRTCGGEAQRGVELQCASVPTVTQATAPSGSLSTKYA